MVFHKKEGEGKGLKGGRGRDGGEVVKGDSKQNSIEKQSYRARKEKRVP